MVLLLVRCYTGVGSNIGAAVVCGIAVEDLSVPAAPWDAHPVVGPHNRREVAANQYEIGWVARFANVEQDAAVPAVAVDPLETGSIEILLV